MGHPCCLRNACPALTEGRRGHVHRCQSLESTCERLSQRLLRTFEIVRSLSGAALVRSRDGGERQRPTRLASGCRAEVTLAEPARCSPLHSALCAEASSGPLAACWISQAWPVFDCRACPTWPPTSGLQQDMDKSNTIALQPKLVSSASYRSCPILL